ncbi:hypothetical protein J8273_4870 [Carpediemonas membranifera]|uniref:Uncharacterized protein n=1 Tax=Carpediemonas membranifera TaxID=201153 RepID=A0A8J6ASZ9_9EUKA|nr:hypothetical protein J8273_4870 [Carpediemonas membranifera]|eukprot:KAG9393751.1 hypothetical protein J8273_4870 [Carpediemonas membranifera]
MDPSLLDYQLAKTGENKSEVIDPLAIQLVLDIYHPENSHGRGIFDAIDVFEQRAEKSMTFDTTMPPKMVNADVATSTDELDDLFDVPFAGEDLMFGDAAGLRTAISLMLDAAETYEIVEPLHHIIRDSQHRPPELSGITSHLPLEKHEPRLARNSKPSPTDSPMVKTSAYLTVRAGATGGPPKPPQPIDYIIKAVRELDPTFNVTPPGRPPARPPGMSVEDYEAVYREIGLSMPKTVDNRPSLYQMVVR